MTNAVRPSRICGGLKVCAVLLVSQTKYLASLLEISSTVIHAATSSPRQQGLSSTIHTCRSINGFLRRICSANPKRECRLSKCNGCSRQRTEHRGISVIEYGLRCLKLLRRNSAVP